MSATLTNIDTGKSEPIDRANPYAIAAAAKRLASTTGQNPADVARDADQIASGIYYGRTSSTDFADAMNALSLDYSA